MVLITSAFDTLSFILHHNLFDWVSIFITGQTNSIWVIFLMNNFSFNLFFIFLSVSIFLFDVQTFEVHLGFSCFIFRFDPKSIFLVLAKCKFSRTLSSFLHRRWASNITASFRELGSCLPKRWKHWTDDGSSRAHEETNNKKICKCLIE